LLQDRLQHAILRAQRHDQKVAVCMLDIDHFKRINDSLGHADGDALLTAVSQRLLSTLRETDTIARMGGDEFVIVMPDFNSLEDVKRCGLQIVESTAMPITIGTREINITVSVGICIYPDCGLEADQLLKNADAAMYVVKDTGRNGLHIFTESMIEKSTV
jgi:diguanylate cyclase (GGDEF)-like protein